MKDNQETIREIGVSYEIPTTYLLSSRSIALPLIQVVVVDDVVFVVTVELHLSGLMGTASHSEMQKIRIIGFFFENKLHWLFDVENNFFKGYIKLHIYLRTNKTLI